jgi:glutamate synthase (NADPH/NADH) small chain
VLGINEPPVTIKVIEREIIDHAFDQGGSSGTRRDTHRQARRRGWIGTCGAGRCTAARELDTSSRIREERSLGGLLRYGIPDFKMEKRWIDRRMEQMSAEGVQFVTAPRFPRSPICGASSRGRARDRCGDSRATCRFPGRELPASISQWIF